MGASSKKGKEERISIASTKKANKGADNRASIISPMMPRHYSAKEREEIRKKELRILKGV